MTDFNNDNDNLFLVPTEYSEFLNLDNNNTSQPQGNNTFNDLYDSTESSSCYQPPEDFLTYSDSNYHFEADSNTQENVRVPSFDAPH